MTHLRLRFAFIIVIGAAMVFAWGGAIVFGPTGGAFAFVAGAIVGVILVERLSGEISKRFEANENGGESA